MISTREIGLAVVTLGGGARPEDSVDHSASPGCCLCRRGGGAAAATAAKPPMVSIPASLCA
ncbi:hypothetical protein CIT26_10095 [Mesorhizobium temperatum]|uniref:Uncharacterized protein n=1 Tax=Mesorhizobium temperatum TaxID=241416 RepID=A0A271LR71_9HYPH|nr:hypothetical protein CIT26_10095 [Mesorhizobium temperatum]